MEKNKSDFNQLVIQVRDIHQSFLNEAQKQVNVALTLRNWLWGFCIVQYEQNGSDKAEYGSQVLKKLSERLKSIGIKGAGGTNLKLFRQFYQAYPQIGQSLTDQFKIEHGFLNSISQPVTDLLKKSTTHAKREDSIVTALVNNLSFTHIVELLKIDDPLKRSYYEIEAVKNNWSVRALERAMNSMLYERTGLSSDKDTVILLHEKENKLQPEDIFRNPYILEFLGLEEKPVYSETDLEQAIINHLQHFLMEMGRGFCFEARQKRITFDNTHYRIDLVFYHRILKTHILLDLKLGEFSHADSGQMNVYLNYYRENEMTDGDNPPIGIILCANKNESLVKYATAGLSQQIFVSKYLINLPSEEALKEIIEEEQRKIRQ